ncbi:MAG TPA: VIT1/CCC1 transporter family protein [Bacteroidia bacterium]|nr:VIT1/CCC1 transporter family protein [Bacteroidia bacterium]
METNKNKHFWTQRVKENAVLNPVDRISEVLFGMIMVLTFTGAISVTGSGKREIRELLWAALGCNLAWGIVDAIMYTMNVLFERGRSFNILRKLKPNEPAQSQRELVKAEIQPLVSALLTEEELKQLTQRILELPKPDKKQMLVWQDLYSAFQIFLLVVLCTIPVSIPFVLLSDPMFALRVSNGMALLLLFIGGIILSRYAGFRPIVGGLAYMLIGVLLVFLTMALGG